MVLAASRQQNRALTFQYALYQEGQTLNTLKVSGISGTVGAFASVTARERCAFKRSLSGTHVRIMDSDTDTVIG